MSSQEKLIKQGIKYTDAVFDEIIQRLSQGVKSADTLEAFLEKTKDYTSSNPLQVSGYKDRLLKIILQETNSHKFSRPAQKELVRITIENQVGELIDNVGEDIKDSVRDIVKDGYNQALSQDEIAANISSKVSSIKNKRARAIARTEIARAATVSDYIINKEMGATHFYVECRNTACPVCKEAWHNKWTPENDSSFSPSDTSAGGKGWIGDKTYSMNDTKMLPPLHPNSYDKETYVFTDKGWKLIKDINPNTDKVLSLKPDGTRLEFLKPNCIIKHYENKIINMENHAFNMSVTSDHTCFIHQRRDGGKKGKYFEPQFRKPDELTGESRFLRTVDIDREQPEFININDLKFKPEDFAFFMAWYISEGSVLHNPETAKQRGYPVKITQEIGENREVLEREMQRIFSYLGFRVAIGKSYFEVYSKQLYDYLLPLGYSNEKYIPSEVFTLNKECLNIFLDNYVRGDGHERTHGRYNSVERSVFTSSVRLRDDLSYLILLCGYCPSISLHSRKGTVVEHRNGTYTQNYDIYGIRINSSQYTNYRNVNVTIDENYNDYTYCVVLPKYHTLWVMRNGKTYYGGNCRCVPYFINDGSTPEPTAREPTKEELSTNLTASERAKYANYKRSIASHEQWLRDNPNASQKAISGHRKRLEAARQKLEELRVKAIGSVEVPVTSEPTPEPKQPKPKTTPKEPEPKAEPKPKPKPQREPVPISEPKTPTREQLDKNLTQKERKEYKDIEYEIKWANDILNKASSTDKQKAYAQTRLDAITPRFNELTNKALGLAPKRTRKSSKTKRKSKKKKEPVQLDKPKNARLTKEECDSLTFEQLAEHHDATYKGLVKIASDNNKEYHVFEQTFDNGETFKLHFEKGAVNSYNKEGIASANEIVHEALKVPEVLRKETNEIWFRNTQKTSAENKKGTGFRSFKGNEGGVNTSTNKRWYEMMKRMGKDVLNDPNHRIAINPKYFKKLTSFGDIISWRDRPQNTTSWKHAVHHEFTHSIDTSRDIWKNDKTRLSSREEYLEIERAEPDFTVYAHEQISEAYAEHGGYISYMLANPEEQSKKVQILTFERDENGRRKGRPVQEEIDFEEYKRRFPKHYEYFTKLFEEGVDE